MTRRSDLEKDNIEALFIDVIHENDLKFILIIGYIPPNKQEQMKEFTVLIENAKKEYNNMIVTGDFNAKSQDWNNLERNSSGIILEKYLNESNMLCINDGKATRRNSSSVIDLFLVSSSLVRKVNLCETLNYENVRSDHICVLLEIEKTSKTNSDKTHQKFALQKTDWEKWYKCTDLFFKEWNNENESKEWTSMEEMQTSFIEIFSKCRDESVPQKLVGEN